MSKHYFATDMPDCVGDTATDPRAMWYGEFSDDPVDAQASFIEKNPLKRGDMPIRVRVYECSRGEQWSTAGMSESVTIVQEVDMASWRDQVKDQMDWAADKIESAITVPRVT